MFAFVNSSSERTPGIFCVADVPVKILKYMELVLKIIMTFMICSESNLSLDDSE